MLQRYRCGTISPSWHLSTGVHWCRQGRPCRHGIIIWPNQRSSVSPYLPHSTNGQSPESQRAQETGQGQSQTIGSQPLPPVPTWLILDLATELKSGSLWSKIEETLAQPPWGISEVIKVMQYGIPLSMSLIAVQLLPALLPHSSNDAATAQVLSLREEATQHLGQELLLVGAAFALLWAALGATQPRSQGMFRFNLSAQSAVSVALICCVLFPVVDPLVSSSWGHVVRELTCLGSPADALCSSQGGSDLGLNPLLLPGQIFPPSPADGAAAPVSAALTSAVSSARPFKETLLSCVHEQDYASLGMHFAASCLLGPLWEETFWRGFILPSMASKLPGQLPAAVLCSSLNFATLHLSVASGLPIFILSSACDVLYLRSGSVAPPLLLHAAWNAYQLLGVAFFGKEAFV